MSLPAAALSDAITWHADLFRSYREDFVNQCRQYEASRDIFMAAPTSASADGIKSFRESVDLIAHVADCYPDLTTTFAQDLVDILTLHHAELEPELREKMVGSLVLLRKKSVIDSSTYESQSFSTQRI